MMPTVIWCRQCCNGVALTATPWPPVCPHCLSEAPLWSQESLLPVRPWNLTEKDYRLLRSFRIDPNG